jgi:hypothetical protein
MQQREYTYDPGQHRHKHKDSGSAEAGFGWWEGEVTGKCPRGFDLDLACRLLNKGVPDPPLGHDECEGDHPARLYVLHEGVVYCARPTVAGRSYHAYPVGAKTNTDEELPRHVKRELVRRAEEAGDMRAVDRWLDRARSRVKELRG